MKNVGLKTKKILVVLSFLGASFLFANEGANLYKACAGCHGLNGEKKALGKSEVITAWDSKKVQIALKGYKDGSYGKAMKGVMKGQVAKLDDAKIKQLADYISKMK